MTATEQFVAELVALVRELGLAGQVVAVGKPLKAPGAVRRALVFVVPGADGEAARARLAEHVDVYRARAAGDVVAYDCCPIVVGRETALLPR